MVCSRGPASFFIACGYSVVLILFVKKTILFPLNYFGTFKRGYSKSSFGSNFKRKSNDVTDCLSNSYPPMFIVLRVHIFGSSWQLLYMVVQLLCIH